MLSKADIKFINSLQNKKYRKIEHAFLVEGHKNVQEVLVSDYQVARVLCTASYFQELNKNKQNAPIEIITEKELAQLGTLETNHSALAVVKTKEIQIPEIEGLTIALDGINDPGNLGTIIRIADWYGIRNIVCSNDTVDVYNPKVINATKGSFTRVNTFYTDLESYFQVNKNIPVLAACMEGNSLYKLEQTFPCILLMGNEANGINEILFNYVTNKISIPRIGAAESLNVGVATGIIVDRLLNV